MFHKLLLRLSVNFMAVLMIVLLVLGALVSRFMWINELNTGVEEMKREAEDIARNYEDLSDYQITTRVSSPASTRSPWTPPYGWWTATDCSST